MAPPRPKQEYVEREADESGTPMERFKTSRVAGSLSATLRD